MWIINNRKIFYLLSLVSVVASLFLIFRFGLNLGIDFRGGSLLEIKYVANENISVRPTVEDVRKILTNIQIKGLSVRETGESGFIVRSASMSEEEREKALAEINILAKSQNAVFEQVRFSAIGPIMGKEAMWKSLWSIGFVLLAIIAFIAFAFRVVSQPISSWKYGLIAIIALIHDIIIPTGLFAYLGHFYGVEIDALFVTAVLVILGFSVHDTIVVFDRIREHLKLSKISGGKRKTFAEIVGESIKQTMSRSINTSLTTIFSLFALFVFGPEATKYFSLALIVGIIAGTYSSIFIASNLLVTFERWQTLKSKS